MSKDFYSIGYMIEKLENNLLFIRKEISTELSKETINWEMIKNLGNKAYKSKRRVSELKKQRLESI